MPQQLKQTPEMILLRLDDDAKICISVERGEGEGMDRLTKHEIGDKWEVWTAGHRELFNLREEKMQQIFVTVVLSLVGNRKQLLEVPHKVWS